MKRFLLVLIFCFSMSIFAADSFTQADRERAIRTEVTLQEFMKATDKRFEASDKRFDDMMSYLNMVISIFAAAVGGMFVYIIWDRKTFMNTALQNARDIVDVQLNEVQKEGKLVELIKAMRELAREDPKVKNVLIRFHLL